MACICGRRRSRGAVIATAVLAICAVSPSYAIEPRADTHVSGQPNPQCAEISASIAKRVKSVKALQGEVEKEQSSPARSVTGVFQQLAGEPYLSPQAQKKLEQIELEKRLASDMNSILLSLNCPTVDVERLIAPAPAAKP